MRQKMRFGIPRERTRSAPASRRRRKHTKEYVVVCIHVKRGCEQHYLDLVTPLLDVMRHEETFINAMLNQELGTTIRFMLYETWTHRDNVFDVQIKRKYRKAFEAPSREVPARSGSCSSGSRWVKISCSAGTKEDPAQ